VEADHALTSKKKHAAKKFLASVFFHLMRAWGGGLEPRG